MAESEPSPRLGGRRILLVLEGLELAGAERQALLLARHLARREGARVEVWGLSKPGAAARACERDGIPWRLVEVDQRWSRLKLPAVVFRFARALRAARVEAVLAYTLVPNVLCCAASPLSGARLTVWNQRDAGLGRIARRLERWALRRADVVVANSRPGAAFLAREMGVDPDRVRIVRNGVESGAPAAAPAAWRARLGVDDRAFLACMVAHLSRSKDHATLLGAWRDVVARWPLPARSPLLLLAGRAGDAQVDVEDRVRELGLEPCVRMLGPVDDVLGLLGAVDLGLHSARLEGSPNAVLECMAAGLAVAGTDNEGIRDAVGPEGASLLAPPGDAHALAVQILRAVEDADLRRRMGAANRARIAAEFSAARMCESMTTLIVEGLATT